MSIFDLWLPILAATFACFFMSFLIWTIFKWHNSDYAATDREDDVRAGIIELRNDVECFLGVDGIKDATELGRQGNTSLVVDLVVMSAGKMLQHDQLCPLASGAQIP